LRTLRLHVWHLCLGHYHWPCEPLSPDIHPVLSPVTWSIDNVAVFKVRQ